MRELYGRLARVLAGQGPVLDVGTGSGVLAAELVVPGVDLVLLDIADTRQAGALRAPFLLADATRLPLRSASCAGVHLARVLYHIADWRGALAEAVRVLASGGALCLALGWAQYQGVLRELTGAIYQRAEGAGLRRDEVRADLRGPEDVDAVLERLGMPLAEIVSARATVPVTSRQAMIDAVATQHRWLPGQDLTPLADIGASVLADSHLDPDQPVLQHRTVIYRIYHEPSGHAA